MLSVLVVHDMSCSNLTEPHLWQASSFGQPFLPAHNSHDMRQIGHATDSRFAKKDTRSTSSRLTDRVKLQSGEIERTANEESRQQLRNMHDGPMEERRSAIMRTRKIHSVEKDLELAVCRADGRTQVSRGKPVQISIDMAEEERAAQSRRLSSYNFNINFQKDNIKRCFTECSDAFGIAGVSNVMVKYYFMRNQLPAVIRKSIDSFMPKWNDHECYSKLKRFLWKKFKHTPRNDEIPFPNIRKMKGQGLPPGLIVSQILKEIGRRSVDDIKGTELEPLIKDIVISLLDGEISRKLLPHYKNMSLRQLTYKATTLTVTTKCIGLNEFVDGNKSLSVRLQHPSSSHVNMSNVDSNNLMDEIDALRRDKERLHAENRRELRFQNLSLTQESSHTKNQRKITELNAVILQRSNG